MTIYKFKIKFKNETLLVFEYHFSLILFITPMLICGPSKSKLGHYKAKLSAHFLEPVFPYCANPNVVVKP